MSKKELISLVVPVYNEEGNIVPMYKAIKKVFANRPCDHELIYVNDGSRDNSAAIIKKLVKKDSHVRLIDFARNFGKEIALTAGLQHANGGAAIMLDVDLQHPPTLIPEFIQKWRDGADVVVGIRESHEEKWHKRAASNLFYKIMNTLSNDTDIIPHETDFRLVDRQVIDAFNTFTEHGRITRGLFNWLGFQRDTVYFEAPERKYGEASYSFKKRLRLALDSFIGHSLFLLRFAGYLGVVITVLSGLLGVFIFFDRYVFNDPYDFHFSGPAILAVIIVFLIGIVLVCLGFISLYIAQIHQEVINRPLYVVRREHRSTVRS